MRAGTRSTRESKSYSSNANVNAKTSIGLIGCGRWGSLILRDLEILDCDVHVVARSPESVARAAAGGASSIHSSVSGMFHEKPLDGIVVSVTAGQHHQVVMDVLRLFGSSLPIFCEKPLATSVQDAVEMAWAAKRLFVMDKWRYHPAIRRMSLARATGEFGKLINLDTRRIQPENPHPDVAPAWTYLPHDLSIVLEILGSLPPATVATSSYDGEIVLAVLGDNPWVDIECSVRASRKYREVTARFEYGVLSMTDPLASTLKLQLLDGLVCELKVPGEMPLLAELRAFTGYLRGGDAPRSSAADGARVVRVVQDILSLAGTS